MRRTATKAATLSATTSSREGDKVVLLYGVANRDPRVFDDPERFDVLRNPNPHVGFGGPGPHFCLGAHLARREVAVAFRQLLTRLPDIEVVGEAVPLEAMGIPLVGGIKRLPVRFTPTAPLGTDPERRRSQDVADVAGAGEKLLKDFQNMAPTFRCRPDLVHGIPVARETLRFAFVIPSSRFQLNPPLFIAHLSPFEENESSLRVEQSARSSLPSAARCPSRCSLR